jgi:hypothetical protein
MPLHVDEHPLTLVAISCCGRVFRKAYIFEEQSCYARSMLIFIPILANPEIEAGSTYLTKELI